MAELFSLLNARSETASSFVDVAELFEHPGARLVYRQYATLFFCFAIDGTESELGILDLIQVLVEALDRHFKNVCELDVIFNSEKVRTSLCMHPWHAPSTDAARRPRRRRCTGCWMRWSWGALSSRRRRRSSWKRCAAWTPARCHRHRASPPPRQRARRQRPL